MNMSDAKGWVRVYGRIDRESASGKAILFEFNPPIFNGKRYEKIWIPKKCFRENPPLARLPVYEISHWFWKKILDGTNGLHQKTKKELVAQAEKVLRRIEPDESFTKEEPKSEEPEFWGNVDKVLEKILSK